MDPKMVCEKLCEDSRPTQQENPCVGSDKWRAHTTENNQHLQSFFAMHLVHVVEVCKRNADK